MMIPTADEIKTVTDMRENAVGLLNAVGKQKKPIVITHRNLPKAVMISPKEYNRLMEMIENYMDEQLAIELEKEAKNAKKEDYVSLEEAEKELGLNV